MHLTSTLPFLSYLILHLFLISSHLFFYSIESLFNDHFFALQVQIKNLPQEFPFQKKNQKIDQSFQLFQMFSPPDEETSTM